MNEPTPARPDAGRIDSPVDGLDRVEFVARGGFSTVYRAHQTAFDRTVALKILTIDGSDRAVMSALDRECIAAGRLGGHPNIVTLFDRGMCSDGRPYLLMEYLPNGSLHRRVTTNGPMDQRATIDLAVHLGGAIETAHRAGTLHRDIKPQNVIYSATNDPVLVDFGMAAVVGQMLTTTAPVGFTPAFAGPELLVGHAATVATDVYGFAATIYFALTGEPPVAPGDDGYVAYVGRVLSTVPQAPKGLTRRVRDTLMAGLAVQPTDRPSTVSDFVEALSAGSSSQLQRPLPVLDGITLAPEDHFPSPRHLDSVSLAPAKPSGSRTRSLAIAAAIALFAGVAIGTTIATHTLDSDDRAASTGSEAGAVAAAHAHSSTAVAAVTTVRPLPSGKSEHDKLARMLAGYGPSTMKVVLEQPWPADRPDNSAHLSLLLGSLPEILESTFAVEPVDFGLRDDTDKAGFGRVFATNAAATPECIGLRTRELTKSGSALGGWGSEGVFAIALMWQLEDGAVPATEQVADLVAASGLWFGATAEECTGFDSDGVAIDGGAAVRYDDLGVDTIPGAVVRVSTNVKMEDIPMRFAYQLVAPIGQRVLAVRLYSNRSTGLPQSQVRDFFTAAYELAKG